jgi:outer membrane protein insertion porin family
VERAYRDRGYLDAKVTGQPVFSEDMTRVRLRVVVQEGALYRVKEVQFEGNTIFRDSELLEATRIVVGGPYRPDDLVAAATAISALYADQGYWDVTVPKGNLRIEEVIPAQGTEVTLKFHIAEGEPVFVGRVEIRGLSKTKEDVVRRDLTFYPGQIAAASKFRESEQVLANTGYFVAEPPKKPVQIELAPGEGPLRDAIVRVEEGPTGRFLVSAGVGSDSGLLGGITVEEANFDISHWPSSWNDIWEGNALRGAGQRMSIVLQAGTKRSFYAISWENPSVDNSDYGVGTMLYSRGTVRSEFTETRTGANVTLTQHLWKFVRRYATVGYEFITVEDIPEDSPDVLKDAKGTHSKPYLRVGAAVDRRDSRFMPTDGYQAGVEAELSAGDAHAVKVTAQGEKYWTISQERGLHKQVLGVRGRIGLAQSYGGDLPVYERFYAGGFSSLRGFAFEGVSPAENGKLVGGDSLLTGSVEYSLPITEDDRLQLVTFCDAGYVGKRVADIVSGWSEPRASLGVGIRWQPPFLGPATIEIDLAAPILKQSQDKTQIISFSLGAEQRF